MTLREKPIVHGRDHHHGGADPFRMAWADVGGAGSGGGGTPTPNPTFVADCYAFQRVGPDSEGRYDYVPQWAASPTVPGSTYLPVYRNTLAVTAGYYPGYAGDARYALAIGSSRWFRIQFSWRYLRPNADTLALENVGLTYSGVFVGDTITGGGNWPRPPVPVTAHCAKWSGGSTSFPATYYKECWMNLAGVLRTETYNGIYCTLHSTQSDLLDYINSSPNLGLTVAIERMLNW